MQKSILHNRFAHKLSVIYGPELGFPHDLGSLPHTVPCNDHQSIELLSQACRDRQLTFFPECHFGIIFHTYSTSVGGVTHSRGGLCRSRMEVCGSLRHGCNCCSPLSTSSIRLCSAWAATLNISCNRCNKALQACNKLLRLSRNMALVLGTTVL